MPISYPEQLATLFDFTDGRVSAIKITIKRAKGLGSSLKECLVSDGDIFCVFMKIGQGREKKVWEVKITIKGLEILLKAFGAGTSDRLNYGSVISENSASIAWLAKFSDIRVKQFTLDYDATWS